MSIELTTSASAFRAGDDWFPLDKHGIFDLDREVDVAATWEAMVKLLETGKVKSVGVSSKSPVVHHASRSNTGHRL